MGMFEKAMDTIFRRNFVIYEYGREALREYDSYIRSLEKRIEHLENLQNVSKGE